MELTRTPGTLILLLAVLLSMSMGLAYASLDRRFDMPIVATVTVKVESPSHVADINDDGKVDGEDLRIVARNIGASPPGEVRGDVDGSHVVDVSDLAFVARYFKPVGEASTS